jgi:N-methylhydantoinase A
MADFRYDELRSLAVPVEELDAAALEGYWVEMEASANAAMAEQGGFESVRLERFADMKYEFQVDHLTVPYPNGDSAADLMERLTESFMHAHDQSFGHVAGDRIEVVNLRLRATSRSSVPRVVEGHVLDQEDEYLPKDSNRMAYFEISGLEPVRVVGRRHIGSREVGPLIIEEPDTTVVVPPGWTVARDRFGNLVLQDAG